ncbi:MAG: TetR/AcrR family transcriptional regulator [Candidatus Thiodiazotropha sp. (ex. Lucinisca nassula)]|nr:TetR/AcrR family transcriptional regulator [Candidatus Thiodiazotropha sp. (ex. Lucinisca nassula)]MBW9271765.1 TetR/AcrR family transcriptional regulator [Candidatus Thiodiazotropha sp. (ex. Lucinisca nassula)]
MINRLDVRAKRSQKALMKAGMEKLNENPEATLSDIASHAGVGRATLYRQYETREKLILAIAIDCFEIIDEATAPIEGKARNALDAIRMMFEHITPLTREFQFLMNLERVIKNDPQIATINKKHRTQMIDLVEYAKKKGEVDKAYPTSWIVNLIEGLFYAGWVQLQQKGSNPEEVAGLAFKTFCQGVAFQR